MNGTRFLSVFTVLLSGSILYGNVAAAGAGASSSASSSAGSTSIATFTGKNTRGSVNGDVVQVKDGLLTVNGVSYGTVNEKSVIRYTVQNQEKVLTVDGVVRQPLR